MALMLSHCSSSNDDDNGDDDNDDDDDDHQQMGGLTKTCYIKASGLLLRRLFGALYL